MFDIKLPNAPLTENHPMNTGNRKITSQISSSSISKEKSSEKLTGGLSSSQKGTKSASTRSSRTTGNGSSSKRSKDSDSEFMDANSLDEMPSSHNMNCNDEKFNSDLYDTN